MAQILIIDDEANMRRILRLILEEAGHSVTEAAGVDSGRRSIAANQFDLVITDKKMPDGDGFEILRHCREHEPSLPVVLLTAFATVELAVEAMQAGAFDFISKPFVPEVVTAVAKRATERARLLRENEALREEVKRHAGPEEIVGVSPAMRSLRETIGRVALTNATVLITGETGTGKELVARAIHRASLRSKETFLAVNCAAVSEQLLESELFGHEKGSFTGADQARKGFFEAADRGTLFLDEAGEMSLGLQAKLLRVLTNGEFMRVGATTPRSADVRVIVATNRDLKRKVGEGTFREDLFYRVAVVPIEVPPLRERREDIPVLIESLLREIVRDLKIPPKSIDAAAVAKLRNYDFPGNIRELRNLLERACILARGETIFENELRVQPGTAEDAKQKWIAQLPESISLARQLESIERDLLQRAIKASDGVQAEAARRLGISRSDIAYKLRKYGL